MSKQLKRSEGIKEIENAKWVKDDYECLTLDVHDENDIPVKAWIKLRPAYCDRGHIQLLIDGPLSLDHADSFPRFFFSFEEADIHTRLFLKWRLWKIREHEHRLEVK